MNTCSTNVFLCFLVDILKRVCSVTLGLYFKIKLTLSGLTHNIYPGRMFRFFQHTEKEPVASFPDS